MKKSLIALAVLAASGAAFAQNATVYGVIDVFLGSVKTEAAGASLTQTVIDAGGVSGNRWGVKGSEDLGGGLKAEFNLEQGFSADTGVGGSTGFARQSWVGLTGGFGAVRFGRTTTPYDDVGGSSDAVFDSALSPMNYVFTSVNYTPRPNNTVYYQAPDFNGFSGALSHSLGENKTATTGADSTTSLNLTYGAGPLALQFAYQVQDVTNGVGQGDLKYTRLGASYDLGAVVLMATYGQTKNLGNVDGADASEYQIGADYKASSALTVSASYARSSDNATAGDATRKGYGIGASYSMSKRTSVYGGWESDTTSVPAVADAKHSVLALGIRHAF